MLELSACVNFFFFHCSLTPLRSKWRRSSEEEARRVTVRSGDINVWRPERCVAKFSTHPGRKKDNAASRGFLKAAVLSSVDERQPGGERKEQSFQQPSFNPPGFPLLFTSCLQIHTQRTAAASLSCTPVLHTSSEIPLFLSSGICSVRERLAPVPPDI